MNEVELGKVLAEMAQNLITIAGIFIVGMYLLIKITCINYQNLKRD